jgi:hypothetical protein
MALHEGTGIDGQQFVPDIAYDMSAFGQLHFAGANAPIHTAFNDDVVCNDLTVDRGPFADRQGVRGDIAVYRAVDLNLALRTQVADDLEVRAN